MKRVAYNSLYQHTNVLFVVLLLFGLSSLHALSASAAVFYSTTSQYQANAVCTNPLICGGGVHQGNKAANGNLNDYAVMYTFPTSAVSLRLGLSGTGTAGGRAGVVVANNGSILSLQALGTVTIRTYLQAGTTLQLQESRVIAPEIVKSALLDQSRPTQLEFVASEDFNQVEIVIGGLTNVAYSLRVLYAYAVPSRVLPEADGYISRFGNTAGQYSTAGTGSSGVCVNTDVNSPQNAVDSDLSNHASFSSVATVACPASLTVNLEGTSPAGYYAGFMIGSAGLLDASVLSGLRITTLLNGVVRETHAGADLLELHVLPGGQAQVSFPSTMSFNQVRIERVGLVTALDNLELYYGFGVEPQAFEGTTNVLSNFSNPSTRYQTSSNGLLCVACSVSNPENAANSDTGTSSYAQMNMPLTLGGELSLRLQLNGTGQAGNRAGMVIGSGTGLLDISVLDNIIISTYDAQGNLLESQVGRNLLSLRLLPDGRQEVYFNTTRDFNSVELTIASGLSALASTRVYYAFADDRTGDFPLLVTPPTPLPVQLTTFAARWANGRTELSWTTASEKNSAYFVVERSTGGETNYVEVGRVTAAGTSTTQRSYQLADHEAAAQHASTLYYRLRQVDMDEATAYSPVVAVKVGKLAGALQLYPNPAAGAVHVNYADAQPGTQLELYSNLGQLVRRQAQVDAETTLNTASLTSGIYQVVLRSASGQTLSTARLVVQQP